MKQDFSHRTLEALTADVARMISSGFYVIASSYDGKTYMGETIFRSLADVLESDDFAYHEARVLFINADGATDVTDAAVLAYFTQHRDGYQSIDAIPPLVQAVVPKAEDCVRHDIREAALWAREQDSLQRYYSGAR